MLDYLFTEAKRDHILLKPDEAIEDMETVISALSKADERETASESILNSFRRMNTTAMLRDAHHYAVDLFYNTYYPTSGAPPLSLDYLDVLLKLKKKGLNNQQIARRLGAKTDAEAKQIADRIRKELAGSEKRYKKMLEEIHTLGAHQWKEIEKELNMEAKD
jgi:hypothetical protein